VSGADPRVDEPVRAHRSQFREVVDGIAVLHRHDDAAHVADDVVEPALMAPLVDPLDVLVEER